MQSIESHDCPPTVFIAELHPLLLPPSTPTSWCGSASSVSLFSATSQVAVLQKYKPAEGKSYERALPHAQQNRIRSLYDVVQAPLIESIWSMATRHKLDRFYRTRSNYVYLEHACSTHEPKTKCKAYYWRSTRCRGALWCIFSSRASPWTTMSAHWKFATSNARQC
jgi:hypothetical protein